MLERLQRIKKLHVLSHRLLCFLTSHLSGDTLKVKSFSQTSLLLSYFYISTLLKLSCRYYNSYKPVIYAVNINYNTKYNVIIIIKAASSDDRALAPPCTAPYVHVGACCSHVADIADT